MDDQEIVDKYQEDLDNSGLGSRYKILSLEEVIKRKQLVYKFRFRDIRSGVEFVYAYSSMKNLLKKDPDRKFRSAKASLQGVEKWAHKLTDYSHLTPLRMEEDYCVILDSRFDYEFTYKSVHQLVSELDKDPTRIFGSVTDQNEKWLSKLNDLAPGRFSSVSVVGRSDDNRPILKCYDSLYEEVLQLGWPHMRESLNKDSCYQFVESLGEAPEERWQRKLNSLGASHLKIVRLERTDPASGYRFRILDIREDYDFSYFSYNLYSRLKEDPLRSFKLDIPVKEYYQSKLNDLAPGRFVVVAHVGTDKRTKKNGAITSVSHSLQVHDKIHDQEFIHEASSLVCKLGKNPDLVVASNIDRYVDGELVKKRTGIEATVESWLKDLALSYEFNPYVDGVRPDFVIPSSKIAIECDGLYWHSELKRDKKYHITKRDHLESRGYTHLAFRRTEIVQKPHVCRSIILNSLGRSTRVFARKCTFTSSATSFFEENHLMGKGSGRVYSLDYEGDTVAAIQVKWVAKTSRTVLDISRFCTKAGISVVGGWSRLIKKVIQEEKPKTIQTFIDRRYGRGFHLEKQGWSFIREGISFVWTDLKDTYHRMRYPGKTGYEHGMVKLWDCGQARWELDVSV